MNIRYNFKHIIISVENIQVFSILHKIVLPPKSDLRSLSTFIFPNVQNKFPVGIYNTEKGDSPKLNLFAKINGIPYRPKSAKFMSRQKKSLRYLETLKTLLVVLFY